MSPLIPLLLFWIDISLYQLCQGPIIYSVAACYSALLLQQTPAYPALITALLLSGLEGFLVYGTYGANFIILLPLTLIALAVRHYLASNIWVTLSFGAVTVLLQIYALPLLIRTI